MWTRSCLGAIRYPAIMELKDGRFAVPAASAEKGRIRLIDPVARTAREVSLDEGEALLIWLRHSRDPPALVVSPERRDWTLAMLWTSDDTTHRNQLLEAYSAYVDRDPLVLQYRRAHVDGRGFVAPCAALPTARTWPRSDEGLTYDGRLTGLLPKDGRGAEIGPLNIPQLSKGEYQVLYVDAETPAAEARRSFLMALGER